MYSTCIYCHRSLGTNAVVEPFPVGRRLAFDGAKGRLWVVCPRCARWNLTPFDERWETVEWCERRFRALRLRVQTANIGFARAPEGLDLIRIGAPLRPELAAWRYGDQFRVRFRRNAVRVAGVGTALASLAAGTLGGAFGSLLGSSLILLPPLCVLTGWTINGYVFYRENLRATRVPRPGGRPFEIIRSDLRETGLVPDGSAGWALRLRSATGWTTLAGEPARTALGLLLPRVNEAGARAHLVAAATTQLVAARSPEDYLCEVARKSKALTGDYAERLVRFNRDGEAVGSTYRFGNGPAIPKDDGALLHLPVEMRLALEMALHEASERRAMEGEMAALETAWREAEEVAAIADHLLPPPGADEFIARHRSGGGAAST